MNYYTLKNGNTLLIRDCQIEDCEELAKFSTKTVEETDFLTRTVGDEMLTKYNWEEIINDYNNNDKACQLVAIYDGKIVGQGQIDFWGTKLKHQHKCELDLAILKDYWGLGIGGRMMIELIKFAKSKGFEAIDLSVIHNNTRAIELYKSFGFKETGIEEHCYKYLDGTYGDMVQMIKYL